MARLIGAKEIAEAAEVMDADASRLSGDLPEKAEVLAAEVRELGLDLKEAASWAQEEIVPAGVAQFFEEGPIAFNVSFLLGLRMGFCLGRGYIEDEQVLRTDNKEET